MILSSKRITKALISLRRCAGWSAPLFFTTHRRQVFSLKAQIESNLSAPVLLSLLKMLHKVIKCSASPSFYHIPLTHLIDSIKHEHSYKIFYANRNAEKTQSLVNSFTTSLGTLAIRSVTRSPSSWIKYGSSPSFFSFSQVSTKF